MPTASSFFAPLYDDILDVSAREQTEDIQKMGGSEALEEPYMRISLARMVKKRAGWLVILFLGEMLTATAMGFFEGEIEKAVVLALFVPLIINTGGNAGSQTTSLIIRALSLREITVGIWWRVMRREILAGLALGIVLGSVGFVRLAVWQPGALQGLRPALGIDWAHGGAFAHWHRALGLVGRLHATPDFTEAGL